MDDLDIIKMGLHITCFYFVTKSIRPSRNWFRARFLSVTGNRSGRAIHRLNTSLI